MDAGTVTIVFIPMRSLATIAVKIFVRLARAHGVRALRCQRKRPVSRLPSATSCASMAGTGMGWRVAAGRGGAGRGVEVATGAGVEVGLARNWLRSGRRSGASTTVAELTSRVPAAAGWGGSRRADRTRQGADGEKKDQQARKRGRHVGEGA